jgi:small subunit ribosomal protein S6
MMRKADRDRDDRGPREGGFRGDREDRGFRGDRDDRGPRGDRPPRRPRDEETSSQTTE